MSHKPQDLGDGWQKSHYSGNGSGNSVLARENEDGTISLWTDRYEGAEPIIYTREEIRDFFQSVKEGEFDHLLPQEALQS